MKRMLHALPLLLLCSCAGMPSTANWRQASAEEMNEQQLAQKPTASHIDEIRASGDLDSARTLALAFVTEFPEDPEALWRASRAESDAVFMQKEDDKEARNTAAASAVEYARQADKAGASSPEALGQFSYAMGSSTHLLPMMSRSAHARETHALVEKTLALDPKNADALATEATLQLRLMTLPTMAKVMAVRAPDASLEGAEEYARKAVAACSSIQNTLLLSKVLHEEKKDEEAIGLLKSSLAEPDKYPRDKEMRSSAQKLLDELEAP